jgi:putative acetyltransferase
MSIETPALRHASRQMVRELNLIEGRACCGELSLSESHFLLELSKLGEATAKEIADRLVLDKSTVSRICGSLQARNLVSCCAPSGDKRRKPLRVTHSGLTELDGIDRVADRQVNEALEFVAETERARVLEGLDRYARALRYARLSRDYTLRRIAKDDNPAVARVIRDVMTEFDAVGCGYSIEDPEVDDMYGYYQGDRTAFFVIEKDSRILGCAGVGRLHDGSADTCELRKMYFLPELRGTGMGTKLLNTCLQTARDAGYRRCYLETLESMHHARKLYGKHGFRTINGPMGNTGHSSCDQWMVLNLAENHTEES